MVSRTCLACKEFTETNRRQYIGQQPGTKSARRPAGGQPVVNRWFCSLVGLHRVFFVRASIDTPRKVFFDLLKGKRDVCLLAESSRRRPVLPVPASSRRPAARRPVPTRVCYVRILDSTSVLLIGLHGLLFARAFEELVRTVFFDAMDVRKCKKMVVFWTSQPGPWTYQPVGVHRFVPPRSTSPRRL